jgi:hypothetical protein
MIATHLIWRAAGYPTPPNAVQVQGVCWWCASGLDSVPLTGPALGVPLSTMPDTFLDALGRDAGAPASPYICPACAWTLSDAVCLPESVGVPLLHRALAGDQEHPGRLSVAVGDEPPARRLVTSSLVKMCFVWVRRVLCDTNKVRAISAELGCDPSDLMSCIAFETGESFSPSIRNKASGATGLIQFMPRTAKGLGTTVEALAAMTAEDQLNYVAGYFEPWRGRLLTLEDLYMAILWPRAVGKPNAEVLFRKGTVAYDQNAGLDANQHAPANQHAGAGGPADALRAWPASDADPAGWRHA